MERIVEMDAPRVISIGGGTPFYYDNFKNMSSKILPNFYVAGEVLNIDAVTGGFNFQACWSEAWLIAQDLNNL